MECLRCGTTNPPGASECSQCSTPFPPSDSGETVISENIPGPQDDASNETVWVAAAGSGSAPVDPFTGQLRPIETGTVLAGRYEILGMLGEGGMGAVYKARDGELDRVVALKVIRPKLANNPAVLARFKQEIILARQVTHRNVIRIFDLGMGDGVKFITMEFVEGQDLKSLLGEKGKYTPSEAAQVMLQVCEGLEAAHREDVIHRDLKPQNVMVDAHGRILLMDFGLALSAGDEEDSESGGPLGTPDYMSPEQVRSGEIDARSDLFTMGVIFYELLTGKLPFEAPTSLETMQKRIEGEARPPVELDAKLPKALNDIVVKCLRMDPEQRYQSVKELRSELEIYLGVGEAAILRRTRRWKFAAPAALVVASAVFGLWTYLTRPVEQKIVSLLIADFDNQTADSVLDGTLEPALQSALEGATLVNAFGRPQARRIAQQLSPGQRKMNEALARLVATREGIELVLAGSISRGPEGYQVGVHAVDAMTARRLGSWKANANDRNGLLNAIGEIATPVRKALGDVDAESTKLASVETYSSASLDAAHSYAEAQEMRYSGRTQEAIQAFRKATELDPKFGTAFAGLAALLANLGQREEALSAYKTAISLTNRMTEREKFRTRGGYFLASMDAPKAIEEFSTLVKQYPADSMGHGSLAFAYYLRGDMANAMQEGRKALAIFPKNVPYRNNVALYSLYAGDFDTASKEATTVLRENQNYLKGYMALGAAELARGNSSKAVETYRRMADVSPLGASFASACLADVALYQGRISAAIDILKEGIQADLKSDNAVAVAKKRMMLAEALLVKGRTVEALSEVAKALKSERETLYFAAARIYIAAGREKEAARLAEVLGLRFEPVQQAYAKLIDGEIALKKGKIRDALRSFEESLQESDTWIGRLDRGRAYLAAEAYPRADGEFDKCMKRRGEAVDVFFDDLQSYRFYPPLLLDVAKAREGIGSTGAAEAYKEYLALKAPDSDDPTVQALRRKYQ